MKRKIVIFSFATIVVACFCLPFFWQYRMAMHQIQSAQIIDSKDEIIAPAIIDSGSDMTHVSTIQSGIIKNVNVSVGQMIKKGEVLFSLDDTVGQYNVTVSRIALKQSENNFNLQKINLKHAEAQLKRLRSIDKRAINQADLRDKAYEVKMGAIKMEQLKDELESAQANLKNAELALKQFNVTAPKDGIVLQINAHVDEYIGAGSQVVLLGDAQKVLVRVSIEERDSKKFSPEASVYLAGEDLNIPLTFIQLERYIITNERLNARVQEALYFFNRSDYPNITAGRQFDAHIAVKKA